MSSLPAPHLKRQHRNLLATFLVVVLLFVAPQYIFFLMGDIGQEWACFVQSTYLHNNQHLTKASSQTSLSHHRHAHFQSPALAPYEPCLASPFNSTACRVNRYVIPAHHFRRIPPQTKSRRTAAMCLFIKNEHLYIQEFVDYHLALGFDEIYVYDNSPDFNLQHWAKYKVPETLQRITLIHWPGSKEQVNAYRDCHARMVKQKRHTWMAVLDVDEMLILKQHDHVVDMLETHCKSGSCSIYWYYFGHSQQTRYQPLPLAKRFVHRSADAHVLFKTIGVIKQVNPSRFHVHFMKAIPPATHHDLLGVDLRGRAPAVNVSVEHRNKASETIAAVHHYWSRSVEEFVIKACVRGRPINHKTRNCHKTYHETMHLANDVLDDSAWTAFKHFVPEYAHYDTIPNVAASFSSLQLEAAADDEEQSEEAAANVSGGLH